MYFTSTPTTTAIISIVKNNDIVFNNVTNNGKMS